MKFLKGLMITIGVIVIVVVLVLGYLGFVPGVSNVFGSNQPKNLGVTYTAADYTSAHTKDGTTHTVLPAGTPPENSIVFSGQHPVNTIYTQAEFNALINNRQWEYYPLKDCQVRINSDNTVEFTGIVITSRLDGYMKALKVSNNSMSSITDYLKYIPGNPAFYAKGTLEVINGQIVNTQITQFKVGNLSFTKQIQDKLPEIINAAYSQISKYPGFSIKTLKLSNGQVQFVGTLPDSARTIISK
jgi:hypothetical protein